MSARNRRESGFALIDALLAVAVLSVGLVAVLDAFMTGGASLEFTKNTLIANLLAQSKMEQYNSVPSSAISDVTCCTDLNSTNEFTPASSEGSFPAFKYEMQKTSEVASYVDRITLTVHYRVMGKDKKMVYTMLKGKKT